MARYLYIGENNPGQFAPGEVYVGRIPTPEELIPYQMTFEIEEMEDPTVLLFKADRGNDHAAGKSFLDSHFIKLEDKNDVHQSREI